MKHKQNGFGIVEIIIIILVVGVLGFGAWYVWQANNPQNNESNPAPQQNANQDADTTQPQTNPDAYADWKSYSQGDLTFKYPADWTLAEIGPGPQLKSGDYAATGLQSTMVTKGASLAVTKPSAPQTAITAENYTSSSAWGPAYSNFRTVTINGKQAAQYNVSEDIIRTVLFSTDGKMTQLQLQFAAADYEQMLAIYSQLLETVEVQ